MYVLTYGKIFRGIPRRRNIYIFFFFFFTKTYKGIFFFFFFFFGGGGGAFLSILMVSDITIHKAFRMHNTLYNKPQSIENFFCHYLPKLYIGFNGQANYTLASMARQSKIIQLLPSDGWVDETADSCPKRFMVQFLVAAVISCSKTL